MTKARFPNWVYSVALNRVRGSRSPITHLPRWIRVALTLFIGGAALEAFAFPPQPSIRLAASILLLVLGLAVPILAWFSWAVTERALRCGEPLPASPVATTFIAVVITVVALVLLGEAMIWPDDASAGDGSIYLNDQLLAG